MSGRRDVKLSGEMRGRLTGCLSTEASVRTLVFLLSRVPLFSTPWTEAHKTLLSMGFPRQEYWSGSPLPPSPGGLPDPGTEPASPAQAGGFFTLSPQEAVMLGS